MCAVSALVVFVFHSLLFFTTLFPSPSPSQCVCLWLWFATTAERPKLHLLINSHYITLVSTSPRHKIKTK